MASAIKLSELLQCKICFELPKENRPIFTCLNGHQFCDSCMYSLRNPDNYKANPLKFGICPYCAAPLGDTNIRNRIAEDLVQYASVLCENNANGCSVEVSRVNDFNDLFFWYLPVSDRYQFFRDFLVCTSL